MRQVTPGQDEVSSKRELFTASWFRPIAERGGCCLPQSWLIRCGDGDDQIWSDDDDDDHDDDNYEYAILYDFASKGSVERQLHGKGEALLAKVAWLVIACNRVAEVGRLSANAKNAFSSFVEHVFANSRNTKIATKNVVFARICKYMGKCLKPNKRFIRFVNN